MTRMERRRRRQRQIRRRVALVLTVAAITTAAVTAAVASINADAEDTPMEVLPTVEETAKQEPMAEPVQLVYETPLRGEEPEPLTQEATEDPEEPEKIEQALVEQGYLHEEITRYDTARRNHEDMAEALRMAASAKEDHDRMIHLRGVLSQLAWRAAEANRASEEERPRKMLAVLGELLSAARMQGLIRDEGGDFK